jgi:DNA-binding NtrC family response regulator
MAENILIVDDELDMLELLELIILDKTPYQVSTTNNPLEALQLLGEKPFDLLITDLRMPAMGGLEVIREVRGRYPDLPVIVITAYGSSESAEEAVRAGAYDYITKPFRKEHILISIDRAMEWRKMKTELAALKSQRPPAPSGN